jgi:hypothetical protein
MLAVSPQTQQQLPAPMGLYQLKLNLQTVTQDSSFLRVQDSKSPWCAQGSEGVGILIMSPCGRLLEVDTASASRIALNSSSMHVMIATSFGILELDRSCEQPACQLHKCIQKRAVKELADLLDR